MSGSLSKAEIHLGGNFKISHSAPCENLKKPNTFQVIVKDPRAKVGEDIVKHTGIKTETLGANSRVRKTVAIIVREARLYVLNICLSKMWMF